MLLSSALDAPEPRQPRRPSSYFASPPSSPPNSHLLGSFPATILNSCQSLQSIMESSTSSGCLTLPPPSAYMNFELPQPQSFELRTPPMAHALPPTCESHKRLRVRSGPMSLQAPNNVDDWVSPRKKIVKRPVVSMGVSHKRRRPVKDNMGRNDTDKEDSGISGISTSSPSSGEQGNAEEVDEQVQQIEEMEQVEPNELLEKKDEEVEQEEQSTPRTPKRSRVSPENLPLGLERSDFHAVYQADSAQNLQHNHQTDQGTYVEREKDNELWSVEDDKVLVELILAKMKLKPQDWKDCAEAMGRDDRSLDRRWKTLMANNHVGVTRRRTRLHSTWR